MTNITFVQPDGSSRVVQAEAGISLMSTAKKSGVEGILGECGGVLSCGTCHVYVDPAWVDRLEPASENEAAMLDFVAAERRPESRLSCQIKVSEAIDGLLVVAAPIQED